MRRIIVGFVVTISLLLSSIVCADADSGSSSNSSNAYLSYVQQQTQQAKGAFAGVGTSNAVAEANKQNFFNGSQPASSSEGSKNKSFTFGKKDQNNSNDDDSGQ